MFYVYHKYSRCYDNASIILDKEPTLEIVSTGLKINLWLNNGVIELLSIPKLKLFENKDPQNMSINTTALYFDSVPIYCDPQFLV